MMRYLWCLLGMFCISYGADDEKKNESAQFPLNQQNSTSDQYVNFDAFIEHTKSMISNSLQTDSSGKLLTKNWPQEVTRIFTALVSLNATMSKVVLERQNRLVERLQEQLQQKDDEVNRIRPLASTMKMDLSQHEQAIERLTSVVAGLAIDVVVLTQALKRDPAKKKILLEEKLKRTEHKKSHKRRNTI